MTDENRPRAIAQQAVRVLDLTSLNDNDTEASIEALCQQAAVVLENETVQVAALCIYPRFLPFARARLDELGLMHVRLATVSNFPHGRADIDQAVKETLACVAYGADEVDVVFPYRSLLDGDKTTAFNLVKACKNACPPGVQLKVILETGELKDAELIAEASDIAIDAGADFIKTSTGKVAVNATLEAAQIMLQRIAAQPRNVGFKPAGGVKTLDDVSAYFDLVSQTVGAEFIQPAYFRFGASSLLATLKQTLTGSEPQSSDTGGY